MNDNKTNMCRDNFPGYMGHIPLKNEVIGMTVGASNDFIKKLITTEPSKEEVLFPQMYDDYSYYNKDYFNQNFSREYKLEENKIFSNNSKGADTWIGGSKYKIYPQHVPGYKAHVPGIYSSNIYGLGYSKSTAIAVKGDYCKKIDFPSKERYLSTTNKFYPKPKVREGNYNK
jgi:hypothetical protein